MVTASPTVCYFSRIRIQRSYRCGCVKKDQQSFKSKPCSISQTKCQHTHKKTLKPNCNTATRFIYPMNLAPFRIANKQQLGSKPEILGIDESIFVRFRENVWIFSK